MFSKIAHICDVGNSVTFECKACEFWPLAFLLRIDPYIHFQESPCCLSGLVPGIGPGREGGREGPAARDVQKRAHAGPALAAGPVQRVQLEDVQKPHSDTRPAARQISRAARNRLHVSDVLNVITRYLR